MVSEGRKLILRDYGRNVQRMVAHALTLEDRTERTLCVKAIVRTMQGINPVLRQPEALHVAYDHVAIMSDFALDIDWPYGKPEPEQLQLEPARMPYQTTSPIRMRHYGRLIEAMVQEAVAEQDEMRRRYLIVRIANKMKQQYLIWNKDHVEERQIREDIALLSDGQLSCDFEDFHLLHGWQLVNKPSKNNAQNKNNPQNKNGKKNGKNKKNVNTPKAK